MKVKNVVFVLVVILSLVVMSCSQHTCPAYSQEDDSSTEERA